MIYYYKLFDSELLFVIVYKIMQAVNWLFRKVVKVRVQGPIDFQIQKKILPQLVGLNSHNCRALVMIINSYGGSLRVAKNLSHSLQQLKAKNIPVYCFAEQFCLNSANLILTSSTQCFASKLSIIGDFGYVYNQYSFDQLKSKYQVGLQKIYINEPQIHTFGKNYQFNNQAFVDKLLKDSANELRSEILQSRRSKLREKNIDPALFQENVLKGGSLVPLQAQKYGFIDGTESCEHFICMFRLIQLLNCSATAQNNKRSIVNTGQQISQEILLRSLSNNDFSRLVLILLQYPNQMQEAWGEKGDNQIPLSKGYDQNSEQKQNGSERKPSKRRQIQEERTVVLDLLRDLLSRVNQRYHRPVQPQVKQAQKIAKASKSNTRNRRKQIPRENNQLRVHTSVQQNGSIHHKQQLWNAYSLLMDYTLIDGFLGE